MERDSRKEASCCSHRYLTSHYVNGFWMEEEGPMEEAAWMGAACCFILAAKTSVIARYLFLVLVVRFPLWLTKMMEH